jgi:broad specificity phosphatase PhoE
MKKFLFALVLSLFTFSSYAQETLDQRNEPVVTTYYLIRHAEKQRQNPDDKDPSLTFQGYKRADKWRDIFQYIPLNAVYSTSYNRTKETANPTAESKNLPILVYDPRNMYTESFQYNTKGKNVLIVGHSNTTPAFVNKILGINKYKQIDDNNNGNLYIVKVIGDHASASVLRID